MRRLIYLLLPALAERDVTVGVEGPVRLDDRSEPLPDLYRSRRAVELSRTTTPRPTELLLVVEVSDSSLDRDRRRKRPAYAAAGASTVWIVALGAGEMLEHRDPEPGLSLYRSVRSIPRGGSLSVPETDVTVRVDELLG